MKQRKPNQFVFEAIGTKWVIDFEGSPAFNDIEKQIESFDRSFSRFRQDSLVAEMSKKAGTYTIPPDGVSMLDLYCDIYRQTSGLVTPLIGQTMEESGYDANYSLVPKELHKLPTWDDILIWDSPKLTLKKPALLDFGAAGKGKLVDLVGNVLQKSGATSFCVDAGGDILISNRKMKIGLEHPNDPTKVIGAIELESGSVCGSSSNRRKWRDFHHIINPRTLKPTSDVLAVWVLTKETMLADALSTCLFFVDPENLSTYKFDYLIIYPDYTFKKSKDFPGELYEAN